MQIIKFIKKNIVLGIAAVLAILTMFFVKPDKNYINYFDFKTLACLFSMSIVICGLKNIRFFEILAERLVGLFRNTRSVIIALVFITYFSSMLIANDMALITFLPLGIIVLKLTKNEKYMIITFIMQNIAANLGGMLTPFGNPQNLYLYNFYQIPTLEFFQIMIIPFLVSVVLIIFVCLCIKKEKIEFNQRNHYHEFNPKKMWIYLALFILSVLVVFRVFSVYFFLVVIIATILLDRKSILQVDYGLLLTFCMFFIFTGNLARIEVIKDFLSDLVGKNTLLTGVLSCQFISNVPTSVLLSNFTTNYRDLLIAVNIASVGSLVSSLASLITFKHFTLERPKETKKYLLYFHLINLVFVVILYLTSILI